ncbi:PHB depolymerase family esterase [Bosea sp. BIWAKO-01]|uniref:extracellular catalytic domain type 1 short-chain-length polyhydroxyalkanoate depolymerase n=1 Tax=Bosea sp. BIWAKO-01 TaxID=506668 RepID=UPI0008535C49|nr:PHB depolymerase family esterase [Bosea sp. BIWAKO-01]GAU84202.1 poly(3-hydroxyalkanoate) depolymerase [Bosea sp. BIWAKO-01]
MRNLSDTIARLKSVQGTAYAGGPAQPSRLSDIGGFGSNPGALRAYSYIPQGLKEHAPLVVVLHGCTQTAAGYDHGAGWSQLAERHGFALLYPEQQRANNPNLCFNWFVPDDIGRDSGEALSIAQMVRRVVEVHDLDQRRVYITGLSAGGAMSLVMLATYPELFASGAIIAGLPYGCATSIPEAFDRMRGHGLPSEQELDARVRRASSHQGPWPTLSLWHGSADQTVAQTNMDAILAQWSGLHGLERVIPEQNAIGVHVQRLWRDKAGIAKIETFSISGMGHGTPLSGADDIGAPGAFMLDARISSTRHIARFWQLTETGSEVSLPKRAETANTATTNVPLDSNTRAPSWQAGEAAGVGKVIEDALRAAGLMR